MSLVGKGNYYAPVVKRHQHMKSTEEINDDSIKIIDNKLQNTPFHKLLLHQYKKHYYMWSDGSLGYKPRQIGSQTYHTIHKYTYGSKSFTLKMYCQMIWLSFHFLMLFCIYNLFKNKVSKKLCLPTITLLGAYLFYAIWEIKSNYAIPFVPFILILAAMGGTELENKLDCIRLSSRKIYKTTIATIGVAFIGILLSGTVLVTEMPVPANQEKIYNIDFKGQDIKNVSKHSRTIKQEFYVNSDFDVISVSVTNIHKSVGAKYKFVLKNSQNKIIRKTKIGFRPHNKGFLTIRLAEKYHPKKLEKFTLEIKGLDKPTDNYIFKSSTSPYIDCVKGNLYIDGNKVKQDMKIIVSETQNTPLLSKKSYFTLIAFIGIIELLIYYSLTKSKNI